jgi:peptidoglycan/xylan/chitin deacetylase (PgdA/CDA1 family)
MLIRNIYYLLKPFIPRWLQIELRRRVILRKRLVYADVWPIDEEAARPPKGWSGWPEGNKFALVLTHDVDTAKGQQRCIQLTTLEASLGFRSSFNFVAKKYEVSAALRKDVTDRGFEVGLHGLYHDGKLYKSRKIFQQRAKEINQFLHEWQSIGFRSPSMQHNLDWIQDLNIEYDASTFDTDPFEPQPDGVGTIFPFWVEATRNPDPVTGLHSGFVELPYTLAQDFTLFILMKERNIEIWKKKLDWIAKNGGMALLNAHPDYMNFYGKKLGIEEYPAKYYEEFLEYVQSRYEGQYWHVLPQDLAAFWKKNYGHPSEGIPLKKP